MDILTENLNPVISQLKKCHRENVGKWVDTGKVNVANMCDDLVRFFEYLDGMTAMDSLCEFKRKLVGTKPISPEELKKEICSFIDDNCFNHIF